jgi:transposase
MGVDTKTGELTKPYEIFVLQGLDREILLYEKEKSLYEKEFIKTCKNNKLIRNLKSIPGIGEIGAVKLAAIVVDAGRFPDKGGWLSYCGLVALEKMSGGRSYGRKKSRFNRGAKQIFKTAAMSVIQAGRDNPFRRHYEYLIEKKNYAEYNARHTVARRIAIVALGVMKSNQKFEDKWEDNNKIAVNKKC